jgi:hypothetical protein
VGEKAETERYVNRPRGVQIGKLCRFTDRRLGPLSDHISLYKNPIRMTERLRQYSPWHVLEMGRMDRKHILPESAAGRSIKARVPRILVPIGRCEGLMLWRTSFGVESRCHEARLRSLICGSVAPVLP